MLKTSIHFKRLNMSLKDFHSILDYLPSAGLNKEANKDISENKSIESSKLIKELNKEEFSR